LAQAKNYVVAYDKPVGLLINFGANSLQFKKIFNPKYRLKQDAEDLRMNRIESALKLDKSQNKNLENPPISKS
jgi:hypothetical protein